MPLGDSITYDGRAGDTRPASERTGYRQELWLLLQAAGYSVDFVGSLQAGWAVQPAFDPDNEGHPGWSADEIATDVYGWLEDEPADIVLLHIGTNDLDADPDDIVNTVADVKNILDEIDRYEDIHGVAVTVFLARIVNTAEHACPNASYTTTFNNSVAAMALDRINNPNNPAYRDKIVMVDMECGAGLDYGVDTTAPYDHDMYDFLHPNASGYIKMADAWFQPLAAHLGTAGQGSITVTKATDPSGGTGFGFAGDLGAFTLADGLSRAFSGLEARNYKITESLQQGWMLQSVSCIGGDFTPTIDGVTIHLGKAQNVTCTFTNFEPPEVPSGSYLDSGSGAPLYFSFSGGSFGGTRLDAAIDGVVLDGGTVGSYTSQVFDAGGVVKWNNIEWISNVGELPNDRMTDKSFDMSGNMLLLHLNQDASHGETAGFVNDFSGSGHHGAASGAGVAIGAADSGKFRGGYAADGVDDGGHIEVASSSDFNFATTAADGFSFFAWFAKNGVCDSPDDTNEVIASRFGTEDTVNTWWLGCGLDGGAGSNRLVLNFWAQQADDQKTLTSPAAVNDGQWHHGGWVYDPAAGQVLLYLDGELAASEPTTPDPFTSANPLCIGAYGVDCDGYEFVGRLDEAAAFKRALSAAEVKRLYTRGAAGLNLKVRACDDPACNGEIFVDIPDQSPQPLSLTGRYFQYAFDFTSTNTTLSPELFSVTIRLPSADINKDGDVDGSDLYIFTLSYGISSGSPGFDARCDFDGNGTVGPIDLATFAAKFGK
jgi:lysophospholipase L1-like esterase